MKPWRKWSLRSRMVITVMGLAAVALFAANLAGVTLLRDYLTDRLDSEVSRLAQFAANPPSNRLLLGGLGERQLPKGVGDPLIVIRYDGDGGIEYIAPAANTDAAEGPNLSFAEVKELAGGGVHTLTNAVSGERFRGQVIERRSGGYVIAAISLARVDNTINQLSTISLGGQRVLPSAFGACGVPHRRFGVKAPDPHGSGRHRHSRRRPYAACAGHRPAHGARTPGNRAQHHARPHRSRRRRPDRV